MSDNWYYVHNGNRQGPVAQEVISSLIVKQELKPEDFVWKKGFDNWKKVKDVSELKLTVDHKTPDIPSSLPPVKERPFTFSDLNPHERVVFIRIGNDRGGASTDYGPFSLNQLKQLFKEHRINGKTFVFTSGMKEWNVLADLPEYQQFFEELPPVIKDTERRNFPRRPIVARLFIQNNKKLFEGICRDISIGGMQVLVDNFQGAVGDRISINVHPANSDYHFVASGVVVRILEGHSGFSFRFQGLSDEAKLSIEKYIQEN
jgi:hypothetical protein